MRRVKAKKTRLLAAGLLLFSLTACEISVGDISNSFSDFPAPEPVTPPPPPSPGMSRQAHITIAFGETHFVETVGKRKCVLTSDA